MLLRIGIDDQPTSPSFGQRLAVLGAPSNFMTLFRLPLAGLLWLRPGDPRWFLALLALAALSDVVDGRFAHWLRRNYSEVRRESEEAAGAWLDPFCDKVFASSALLAIWVATSPPLALVALALTRELLILPMMVAYALLSGIRRVLTVDFHADRYGKLTTVTQFLVAGALFVIPPAAWVFAAVTSGLGLYSIGHYVRRVRRDSRNRRSRSPDGM